MKLFTWYEYTKVYWIYPLSVNSEGKVGLLRYSVNNDLLVLDIIDEDILKERNIKEKKIDRIYQEEILQQIWEVNFNEL